ncbi:MAG TPA: hypothetical protein VF572_04415 [Candidatus Saccharimonadales bacterium]|jgi:hypothetical protein
MTQAANIPAIERATHKSWDEWVAFLEGIDGRNLSHREIAEKVDEILEEILYNSGWWAQSVTVAYEQHIGRRVPGQNSAGEYEVSVTRTLEGSMQDAMDTWLSLIEHKADFDGIPCAGEPTQTATEHRMHWACNLDDGSRLNADTSPKSDGKVLLAVTHTKLEDQLAIERWREYWKSELATI